MDKKLIDILKTKTTFFLDFDGTIADNECLHFLAHKKNLKSYGFNLKKKDFVECCITKPHDEIMDLLEKRFNFKIEDREKFVNSYLDYDYIITTESEQEVFPYVYELLKLFPHTDKVIISNESVPMLKMFLKKVKLEGKFDVLYSCFKREPKKVTLQNLKKAFNVSPQDAVLFEDSQTNIDSARKAGIFTVGIEHRYNKGLKADFVLKKGL